MDWKSRLKNPYFWAGLIGVILSAMGVNPEILTSWGALWEQVVILISNPYMLFCVTMAIIGVLVDPSTRSFRDAKMLNKKVNKK